MFRTFVPLISVQPFLTLQHFRLNMTVVDLVKPRCRAKNIPFGCVVAKQEVIWCDPVNIFESLGWFLFLHLPFRGQGQPQPWQVMATIDQADIRGSEPHNHDPSGAASD